MGIPVSLEQLTRIVAQLSGLVLVTSAVWHVRRLSIPAGWLTAPGTVTRRWVSERGSPKEPEYTPVIEFTYEVGTQKYTGRRFWTLQPHFDKRSAAWGALRGPEEGKSVTVRYDPMCPDRSVVKQRFSFSGLFGAAAFGAPDFLMFLPQVTIQSPPLLSIAGIILIDAFVLIVLVNATISRDEHSSSEDA